MSSTTEAYRPSLTLPPTRKDSVALLTPRPTAFHNPASIRRFPQGTRRRYAHMYGDLIEIVGTAPLQRDQFFYGRKVNVQDISVQSHLPHISLEGGNDSTLIVNVLRRYCLLQV